MNSRQATVSKILTYSCVDGPGNRLVVFLQGCNFNCSTCHNPYTIGLCNHCGDCIAACHGDALIMRKGRIDFDANACDQCDACLEACPISASPMTSLYTVAQILEIARKHRHFLSGITVSGGEATLHLNFIKDLFLAIKTDPELASLTCFIDTNGHLSEKSWETLLPVTDGVMLDIKAFCAPLHRQLTGKDNNKSLRSAKILNDANKLYEIRFLMIPGKTDSEEELENLITFFNTLNPAVRVRLNAFQHHGVKGPALAWDTMAKTGIDQAAERLSAAGVKTVATPAIYQ
ncbi:MAG: YjjW family glycine radical enzyme activase [Hyphomicrobiales bacterium]|nr:YjjW family glycine radical enzyme activase [Hyphomicrobiales bacterium]